MSKIRGRVKYPCFKYPGGCPNRSPGCQSKCVEMLCAELEADERRKTQRRAREEEQRAVEIEVRRYARIGRYKPKQR